MARLEEAWSEARHLFAEEQYWESHEVLESVWLESQGNVKSLLSGVILCAAALHKARATQSSRGARRNYAKALKHLALLPDSYCGIDIRQWEADVHYALRHPSFFVSLPALSSTKVTKYPTMTPNDKLPHQQMRSRRPNSNRRLVRVPDKALVAGICAGIADYTGTNPVHLRVLFGVACLLSAGVVAISYPLLWLLLPKDNAM